MSQTSDPQYDPASARMCRACGCADGHDCVLRLGIGMPHMEGCLLHGCTEDKRYATDLRHALDEARSGVLLDEIESVHTDCDHDEDEADTAACEMDIAIMNLADAWERLKQPDNGRNR